MYRNGSTGAQCPSPGHPHMHYSGQTMAVSTLASHQAHIMAWLYRHSLPGRSLCAGGLPDKDSSSHGPRFLNEADKPLEAKLQPLEVGGGGGAVPQVRGGGGSTACSAALPLKALGHATVSRCWVSAAFLFPPTCPSPFSPQISDILVQYLGL